jgi:hypothetical protein
MRWGKGEGERKKGRGGAAALILSSCLQALNIVRWSPCDNFLACGGVAGRLSVWHVKNRTLRLK